MDMKVEAGKLPVYFAGRKHFRELPLPRATLGELTNPKPA
jgi:hypothetical protein